MSIPQLNRANVPAFEQRLKAITETSSRRWGTMDASKLMPHLRWLVELSLEEFQAEDIPVPLAKTPIFRWLALNLPWPKGKMKGPDESFPANTESMEIEREKLLAALQRFADAVEKTPDRKTKSPILGMVPLSFWAKLHGKHLNHHLEQFGV
jgi:oxepin-CoA hydrolase / 3-oxo-5,6-dehydrosuberyl-CoA semialdehyde dehydrogenase